MEFYHIVLLVCTYHRRMRFVKAPIIRKREHVTYIAKSIAITFMSESMYHDYIKTKECTNFDITRLVAVAWRDETRHIEDWRTSFRIE